jgi:hypothetical protein
MKVWVICFEHSNALYPIGERNGWHIGYQSKEKAKQHAKDITTYDSAYCNQFSYISKSTNRVIVDKLVVKPLVASRKILNQLKVDVI